MSKLDKLEFSGIVFNIAKDVAPLYGADAAKLTEYLTAIAVVESGLRVDARNKASTARGILQMLICTQRENEKKRLKSSFAPAMFSCKSYPTDKVNEEKDRLLFDVDYAVLLASHELAYQFKRYKKDWSKAVHAYNQGSFPGTRPNDGLAYAKKVYAELEDFVPESYANVAGATYSRSSKIGGQLYEYREFY